MRKFLYFSCSKEKNTVAKKKVIEMSETPSRGRGVTVPYTKQNALSRTPPAVKASNSKYDMMAVVCVLKQYTLTQNKHINIKVALALIGHS